MIGQSTNYACRKPRREPGSRIDPLFQTCVDSGLQKLSSWPRGRFGELAEGRYPRFVFPPREKDVAEVKPRCDAKSCTNFARVYLVMYKKIHGSEYYESGAFCEEDGIAWKERLREDGYEVRTEVPIEVAPL